MPEMSEKTPLSHHLEYRALMVLAFFVRLLPRSLALGAGAAVGQIGWWLGLRRKLVLANLAQALPELSDSERHRLGARSARNFGRTVIEIIRIGGRDRQRSEELFVFDGVSELEEAVEGGRGAVIVTAHLGAWALYFTALAKVGVRIALLVGRQHNVRVDEFIHGILGDQVRLISKGRPAVREILGSLKEGVSVVFVADQHAGRQGCIWAPFLGRQASTLALPGAFVARHEAPFFLMTGHRHEGGKHRIQLRKLDVPKDAEDVRQAVTELFNDELGQAILEHPDQYFWFHRRWRDTDEPPTP